MAQQENENNKIKRICAGVLAHVDVGKTTLSEALLYCSGALRRLGRVDHGTAFLDTFALERQRGITIFSKQAILKLPGLQLTLLDTPGHVDFSPEMERTLDVLDCAILVVSGSSGVQSHTYTLWKLLRQRQIPTFLFINKMDQPGCEREALLRQLKEKLGSENFVDMERAESETIALCDEALLEDFVESGSLRDEAVAAAIGRCNLFPCWFGAALKLEGVEDFLQGLRRFAPQPQPTADFGAKVFKISRDEQGQRLTHMKICGGRLRVRDSLSGSDWTEKVSQLRLYSGAKFSAVEEALPGDVVAAVGLSRTVPGLGLGSAAQGQSPALEPVLTYSLLLPQGTDKVKALGQLRQLEEEEPQLHVDFDARHQEIRVQLMGQVQLEILRQLLLERFGLAVGFGEESILYKETIAAPVEGVGHYEPLRHYAEVHLLLEPGERGSGLRFATACREDDLDGNWQRLVLTHLAEKQHLGVLTGSPITDMCITLTAGRAHIKHTEGGDFRQATYRALRQGLMSAQSILLEPWYDFRLELPQQNLGRAMTDLQRLGAQLQDPQTLGDFAVLEGAAPVALLRSYPQEVNGYTHGLGRFSTRLRGYEPCAKQEEVVAALGYDPCADLENSPDSVFCQQGAGVVVKWDQVPQWMHLPASFSPKKEPDEESQWRQRAARYCARMASNQELMDIFERTYGPVKREDKRRKPRPVERSASGFRAKSLPSGPEYLLVDGYNMIFAWEELKDLARESLDLARAQLLQLLSSYQGFMGNPVIVVFDAYRVKGNPGSVERHGDLTVVYTKEAQTADAYIEKAAYELGKEHRIRVATSDGLEQIIILGAGALRISARSFREEVLQVNQYIREYLSEQ